MDNQIVVQEKILVEFQSMIENFAPTMAKSSQTIMDSVTIANAIQQTRNFLNHDQIKPLVLGLMNNVAGFLTDRSPNAKKPRAAYPYNEIVEALTPCLMDGYRMTGNEINIIAGKGMPVKNGKFRRIIEFNGVTNFRHSIGTPTVEKNIAKMRCQAIWNRNGEQQSIGVGDDICIIGIEKGQYDGLDKLVGLADSKLFSRVLTRLSGKFVAEGDLPDPTDITPTNKPKIPTQLPSGNKQHAETKEGPIITEWKENYCRMNEKDKSDFDREFPGPKIDDLPESDRASRLNDLKTFLKL